MSATMKTINGGTVTSLDDATLYNLFQPQSGIIDGVGASLSGGNKATVQAGRVLIYGRLIDITTTTISLPYAPTTQNGVLYLQAEPENAEAPAKFDVAMSGAMPQLRQDDLMHGGTIYQLPIATFKTSATSIYDFEPADSAIRRDQDFIVEQGKQGIWTWRKWSSGISECWGDIHCEGITCMSAWGSMYESPTIYGGAHFPLGLFILPPVEVMQVTKSDHYGFFLEGPYSEYSATAATSGKFYFVRPKESPTTSTAEVSVIAKGRWKR